MTIRKLPDRCDCVWTISLHSDGSRSGSIFIASDRCQQHLMHPRTFTEPPPVAEPPVPRTHLFDRYLANDDLRTFCGLRNVVIYTHDPGEVTCQVCLTVLEADSLSAEGTMLRKAKAAARHQAVNALIRNHQTEFARLCDDAYPACLAHQQALMD